MAILGNYDTETNQRGLTPNLIAKHALHGSIGFLPIVPLSPLPPKCPPIRKYVWPALYNRLENYNFL